MGLNGPARMYQVLFSYSLDPQEEIYMATAYNIEKFVTNERDKRRHDAQHKLDDALRTFRPEERASEAEAALERIAEQEAREAKLERLRALSDEVLDKLQIP